MKRSYFKRKQTVPMKRTKLRVAGVSDTARDKREIQALVRLICAYRDGGCVLRNLRHCGGEATVQEGKIVSNNVIQADHLITRANSATYSDTRLIVCLCKNCHAWKKWHEAEYNDLVKTVLPKERVELWERCEQERRTYKTHKMDWKFAILFLKKELEKYE